MGLDMYVYAERYISGYEFSPDAERLIFHEVVNAGLQNVSDSHSPSVTVRVVAAYWRKANAIHNWFVTNVQGGVDECRSHYVEREQLKELIDLATAAIAAYEGGSKTQSAELLPPTSGFFFGGTELDDWYLDGLKSTVSQLQPLLTADPDISYYYQSSW